MNQPTQHTQNINDILYTYSMLRHSNWSKQQAIVEVFNRLGYSYASEYARVYRTCNNYDWKQNDRTRNSERMFEDCAS